MKRQSRKSGKRSGKKGQLVPNATSEYQARTAENMAALRLTKALKGPNNKYINTVKNQISSTDLISGIAPYVAILNGVAQGTSENTRIGRLVHNKWLDIDFEISMTSTAGIDNTNMFRVYIVVETTCLGSNLSPSQFFVDNANWSPTSQRDRTNRNASRYVVLWDSKPFHLGSPPVAHGTTTQSVVGAGNPAEKIFSLHIPLDFDTDYSRGNSGTVGDIDTNSLSFLVVNDQGTASCSLVGGWTLCFSDIK